MLGIIIAEKIETSNLISKIKAQTFLEFNNIRFNVGEVNNKKVILCFCGIGKVNAAIAALGMISNFQVNKIFNIGFSGSVNKNVRFGQLVVGKVIQYCDVDVTAFGSVLNKLPDVIKGYEVKDKYVNILKEILKDNKHYVGSIGTCDSVITGKNFNNYHFEENDKILACEMEAMAIAQVCEKTKVDFLTLKIISDEVMSNCDSHKQYKNSLAVLCGSIDDIVLEVIKKIN